MVPPIRWYYIFSTWIFILSATYPLHKISTYPLNAIALPGCFEIILNPHKEHWFKNLYILAIHTLPFLWIPYSVSKRTLQFALVSVVIYLIFISILGENVIHIYSELLNENHITLKLFLADRFGI